MNRNVVTKLFIVHYEKPLDSVNRNLLLSRLRFRFNYCICEYYEDWAKIYIRYLYKGEEEYKLFREKIQKLLEEEFRRYGCKIKKTK